VDAAATSGVIREGRYHAGVGEPVLLTKVGGDLEPGLHPIGSPIHEGDLEM